MLLCSLPTRTPEPEHRRSLDIILAWPAPAAPIGHSPPHDAIAAPQFKATACSATADQGFRPPGEDRHRGPGNELTRPCRRAAYVLNLVLGLTVLRASIMGQPAAGLCKGHNIRSQFCFYGLLICSGGGLYTQISAIAYRFLEEAEASRAECGIPPMPCPSFRQLRLHPHP